MLLVDFHCPRFAFPNLTQWRTIRDRQMGRLHLRVDEAHDIFLRYRRCAARILQILLFLSSFHPRSDDFLHIPELLPDTDLRHQRSGLRHIALQFYVLRSESLVRSEKNRDHTLLVESAESAGAHRHYDRIELRIHLHQWLYLQESDNSDGGCGSCSPHRNRLHFRSDYAIFWQSLPRNQRDD